MTTDQPDKLKCAVCDNYMITMAVVPRINNEIRPETRIEVQHHSDVRTKMVVVVVLPDKEAKKYYCIIRRRRPASGRTRHLTDK